MTRSTLIKRLFGVGAAFLLIASAVSAQSTRPRRAKPSSKTTATVDKSASDPLLRPEPSATPSSRKTSSSDALLDVQPVRPVVNSVGTADTKHAYLLLEQKQFAAAAKEAKELTASHPNDPEAWKIAGFAELNLKQYEQAAKDLEKAVSLQRQAKQTDPNTESALGQAYVLSEKYEQALPYLTAATREPNKPDALMIYYRGISEYKTGKTAAAEKSFNEVVKLNPKDSLSLFYLAQIALAKNDLDGAIASLNRATVNDARLTGAWTLLTSAYLRRAATSADPAKAEADYLSAVRAGEGLIKLRTDAEAVTLFGQALIGSKQYARAAAALERATTTPEATGVTFYLLGVAHSRATNFPKAIAALETAAKKTPDDVNIYRELGYAFEVQKQYAKALSAYERGSALAPSDPDLKESIERVKPFAK